MRLLDRLSAHATARGEALAIVEGRSELTYGGLQARVASLANVLSDDADTPVAVMCTTLTGSTVAMLASMAAGRTFVPIDPRGSATRICAMLDRIDVRTVLVDGDAPDEVVSGRRAIDALERRESGDLPLPAARGAADEIAYILFTSGSTGVPKLVQHRCHTVDQVAANYVLEIGLLSGERLGVAAALAHDAAIVDIAGAIHVGATMVRLNARDPRLWRRPDEWLRLQGVDVVHCVPTVGSRLLRKMKLPAAGGSASGLRAWVFGGEACSSDLLHLVRERTPTAVAFMLYGQTECSIISMKRADDPEEAGLLGHPVQGVEWTAVPTSEGVLELHIRGALVARGLDADGRAPGRQDAAQWSPTGDGVRMTEAGLAFWGRLDDLVKVRGERISLREVESVLSLVSGVREAIVVLNGSSPDARLVAMVDCEPGRDPRLEALNEALVEGIGSWVLLNRVVVVHSGLPVLPSGKLDRRSAVRMCAEIA